jgi:hypothetical protein
MTTQKYKRRRNCRNLSTPTQTQTKLSSLWGKYERKQNHPIGSSTSSSKACKSFPPILFTREKSKSLLLRRVQQNEVDKNRNSAKFQRTSTSKGDCRIVLKTNLKIIPELVIDQENSKQQNRVLSQKLGSNLQMCFVAFSSSSLPAILKLRARIVPVTRGSQSWDRGSAAYAIVTFSWGSAWTERGG